MKTRDTILISSQRYLSEETVEAKRVSKDYEVTLGKLITVDGVDYRVVIDGHHSLAAANADGVNPTYSIATATECDRESIDDLDQYLESHWIDSDYYDVETGKNVWQ